jgi:predicted ABC-type ATPase
MSQTVHRPVLIVIAGPNGSGKTTITSKILRHEWLENALYVNPDQVAQDRFYDNSIDDTEARLLFRMTDGRPFKRYTDDIPEWALTIL